MDSTHARIPDPTDAQRGRPLADVTLWKLSGPRFLGVLAAISVPLTLVLAVVTASQGTWPDLDSSVFVRAFFGFGLGVVLLAMLTLSLMLEEPGSHYCKVPVVRIERFEHELTVRDASGVLLGERSKGSLRVARVNLNLGRSALLGGLRLDVASGPVWLMPRQPVGAWPGLRAEPPNMDILPIDNALFDDLMRLAE
ncbi:Lipoprotein [Corallococcus soli]